MPRLFAERYHLVAYVSLRLTELSVNSGDSPVTNEKKTDLGCQRVLECYMLLFMTKYFCVVNSYLKMSRQGPVLENDCYG